jgi:hypothetical protein
MTAPAQALIRLSQETAPLCSACGRHPVERHGQLCNEHDRDDEGHVIDGDTWHCASKSAYFAARIRGIRWGQA